MKRSTTALLGTALAAALALPAHAELSRHTFKVSNGAAEDHRLRRGRRHVGMPRGCQRRQHEAARLLQLGDDAEATQSVRSGSIEMVMTGAAAIGGIEPATSAVELPLLFASDAEVDAVMTGPFFDHLAAKMPAHDVVLLSIWENGFRNSINNKRPITSVKISKA